MINPYIHVPREQQRKDDEERAKKRQIARRAGAAGTRPVWTVKLQQIRRFVHDTPLLAIVPARYRALLATATLFIGAYAMYKCDYSNLNYIR